MVQVLNLDPHKSVAKNTFCGHCGATLRYVPMDIKSDYTTDYLGDKDHYKYIDCPNCNHKVKIKQREASWR